MFNDKQIARARRMLSYADVYQMHDIFVEEEQMSEYNFFLLYNAAQTEVVISSREYEENVG